MEESDFQKRVKEAKAVIKENSIHEVKAKQDSGHQFFLVDTREDLEWEASRIKGAIHIGKGVLKETSARISLTKTQRSFCTAAADRDPHSLLNLYKRWVTRTLSTWPVASVPGPTPTTQWNPRFAYNSQPDSPFH